MDALQKALTEGMDTAELQQLRDTLSVRPDDPQAYYTARDWVCPILGFMV